MRRTDAALLVCVLTACSPGTRSTPTPVLSPMRLGDLARVLWREQPRTFVPATADERARLAGLIGLLFECTARSHTCGTEASARASEAGFELREHRVGSTRLLVAVEHQHRGHGAYAFRVGHALTTRGVVLSSPHAYHDLDTGELGLQLFVEGFGDAYFTNTVHRAFDDATGRNDGATDGPADACHQPEHPLHIASAALVGRARLVQLHGFGEDEASPFDVVVSDGTRQPGPLALAVRDRLRAAGWTAASFPADFDRLGGTTNAQARVYRASGGFLHLEMSRDLRRRLVRDASLRAQLALALGAP